MTRREFLAASAAVAAIPAIAEALPQPNVHKPATAPVQYIDVLSAYISNSAGWHSGASPSHWYRSDLVEEASARRGYPVTWKEVSDDMVNTILEYVNEYREFAEHSADRVLLDDGHTLMIVYLRDKETQPLVRADWLFGQWEYRSHNRPSVIL